MSSSLTVRWHQIGACKAIWLTSRCDAVSRVCSLLEVDARSARSRSCHSFEVVNGAAMSDRERTS
jgi:hypothetical protein